MKSNDQKLIEDTTIKKADEDKILEVIDNTNTNSENQNLSIDSISEVVTIDDDEDDANVPESIDSKDGFVSSSSSPTTSTLEISKGQIVPENIDSKEGIASFNMFQCPLCKVENTEQNFGTLMKAQMHIQKVHRMTIQMQNGLIKEGAFKIFQKTTVIHGYVPGTLNIAYNTQDFRNK